MTVAKAPAKPPGLPMGASASLPTQETIDDKYRLVREIGSGAAASVYEAEHLIVGKRVALKIMHASVAREPILRDRFVGEARAAAQIDHPNVVDIYDFGVTASGTPFLVMELLVGETLDQLLERRGALAPNQASELMAQILAAVGAAHRLGIVHRDLKPANIVVTYPRPDTPFVKVLDFGIAKGVIDPRGEEGLMGTPFYMAPEQALGKDVDARADVYAAGVILYEILAGDPPFTGTTAEVLRRVVSGQWRPLANVNPAVPRLLAHTVSAAMATDPSRRIQTAAQFAKQLTPYLSEAPPHSVPDGPYSADAFLLRGASSVPEIRHMSESMIASRPPRDFPSLGLMRVAGRPNGEPLADSLLQSPIIPRAPGAPKIHISSSIRDVERWSDAPLPPSHDEGCGRGPEIVLDASDEPFLSGRGPSSRAVRDPLFDEPPPNHRKAVEATACARVSQGGPFGPYGDPVPDEDEKLPPPAAWRRAAWAAFIGIGLGALLAWLYHLG